MGVVTQYERDPLVLHEFGREVGAVIRNRNITTIGGSWQPHEYLAVYASVPVVVQWSSELPEYDTDGVHTGDSSVGVQVTGPGTARLRTTGRAELGLPTGRAVAFAGDGAPRASVDALVGVGGSYLELTTSVGATARRRTDSKVDYDAASELRASGAVPGRGASSSTPARRPAAASWRCVHSRSRPGPRAWSACGCTRLHPAAHVQVDVGMGKGLGHGYGTSEWRTYTGVTWTRIPTPVEAPMPIFTEDVEVLPEVLVTRLPDPEPEPNGPTEVVWAEGEFARLDGDTIELRDELHFVFGTAELLPDSRPTLAQVSRILNENEDLLHVVIEGHASNEGSYRYNYNLSYARSRSVWEALVEDGVHPDRLSTRGMGEVQPKDGTLEADRRVEFHVVARRLDDAPLPTRTGARLPWNGEPVQ